MREVEARTPTSLGTQPRPSTEPAFDLAGLLDESDASFRPAFDKADFDGFDERDDFAITCSFQTEWKQIRTAPSLPGFAQALRSA